jgi:signal transduction histidine kinase
MQERARSIGAQLEITSRTGQGTRVRVDWQETDERLSND